MDGGVRKTGEVPRLIMLHGWGLDARTWNPLRSILDRQLLTEAYDLAGFGEDAGDSVEIPGFEEHVVELTERIGRLDGPVVLIGHSRGGAVSLVAAARDAEKVKAVVTIGSAARFSLAEDYQWGIAREQLTQLASTFREAFAETFDSLLGAFWLSDAEPAAAANSERILKDAARRHRRPDVVAEILTSDAEIDIRAVLPQIEVPVLVLQGTRDAVVSEEAGRWLAQQLPHGEFRTIDGAGHVPHVTRPEATAVAILQFLEVMSAGGGL